ncbi:MAG: hypothetical protein IJU61_09665 [Victivallales bacterium]|nr:hypothetical protein [Victivallales bacterium]
MPKKEKYVLEEFLKSVRNAYKASLDDDHKDELNPDNDMAIAMWIELSLRSNITLMLGMMKYLCKAYNIPKPDLKIHKKSQSDCENNYSIEFWTMIMNILFDDSKTLLKAADDVDLDDAERKLLEFKRTHEAKREGSLYAGEKQ